MNHLKHLFREMSAATAFHTRSTQIHTDGSRFHRLLYKLTPACTRQPASLLLLYMLSLRESLVAMVKFTAIDFGIYFIVVHLQQHLLYMRINRPCFSFYLSFKREFFNGCCTAEVFRLYDARDPQIIYL